MNKRIKKKHVTSMLKSMQRIKLEQGDKIIVQLVDDIRLDDVHRLHDYLHKVFVCPIIILPNYMRMTVVNDLENIEENVQKPIDKTE